MGNNHSREEIIVDYDDEDDLILSDARRHEESILLTEEDEPVEDGHPKVHRSAIIKSPLSLSKESLVVFQPQEPPNAVDEPVNVQRENHESKKEESIVHVQVEAVDISEEKKENSICLEKEPLIENKETTPANRVNLFEPFSLRFRVDAEVDVSLKLYWGASLRRRPKDTYKSRFSNGHYAMDIPKGLNQIITLSPSQIPRFQPSDLKHLNGENDSCIPLLIQLQSRAENTNNRVHQQTLKANFVATSILGTYGIVVQNVTVKIGPNGYTLYDIYGVGKNENLTDGDECVICMSEDSTTTLLPCRHMCLCSECANLFRSKTEKCPICRSRVCDLLMSS